MKYRRPARPDPLAGLRTVHRHCLTDASLGLLVQIGTTWRPTVTLGREYSPQLATALIARGLLARQGEHFLTTTPKGRSLARIIRHRAAVRAKLERTTP